MVDTEAMGEAVTRPTMRFVPSKALAPQGCQARHRVRERLVNACTAFIHGIRGWLTKLEPEQAKLTAPYTLT